VKAIYGLAQAVAARLLASAMANTVTASGELPAIRSAGYGIVTDRSAWERLNAAATLQSRLPRNFSAFRGITVNSDTGKYAGHAALVREVTSGLVGSLLSLTYCFSYGALIFAGPLAPYLADGVAAALMTGAVAAILVALMSGFRLAVAGPVSHTAAPLATMIGTLLPTIAARPSHAPRTCRPPCGRLKLRKTEHGPVGGSDSASGRKSPCSTLSGVSSSRCSAARLPDQSRRAQQRPPPRD